jgi:hypothetical protein
VEGRYDVVSRGRAGLQAEGRGGAGLLGLATVPEDAPRVGVHDGVKRRSGEDAVSVFLSVALIFSCMFHQFGL